jgi:hypothetical protein
VAVLILPIANFTVAFKPDSALLVGYTRKPEQPIADRIAPYNSFASLILEAR